MAAVQYPKPDVNSMVFDPSTGYRFDPVTGLYYNANADLFINKGMNILLRWNPDMCTYTVFGRASDVAASAQDVFQSIGHRQNSTSYPTLPRLPFVADPGLTTVSPPISSSSQLSARDITPFPRERSLTFEEMSPDRDESYLRDGYSPGEEHSPHRYDLFNLRDRRRSLSFDEMTPERDTDLPSFSLDRSPSNERRSQRSNQSPRKDSVFPDIRYNRDRDSNRRRSPDSRGSRERERSPRRRYSRSPRRDHSISSRRDCCRDQYSRLPDRRPSPRRVSRTSSSSLRSRMRGRSPQYTRGRSPERRGTAKRFSPSKETRRRFSPVPSDARGGRFHRSPSPSNQFARILINGKTESGETSSKCERRDSSRSRPRNNASVHCSIQPGKSNSPLGGRDDPKQAVPELADVSNPTPKKNKKKAPRAESNSVEAAGSSAGFSQKFLASHMNRIQKKNLRNPANIYAHMFPAQRVPTAFIMLTSLPPKGDKEWEDLEILLGGILKAEGVNFFSVTIYPGDGGAPFNYCMIRFKSDQEAFRCYMVHDGTIDLAAPDGSSCSVFMNFTHNNWKCKNCTALNFALRNFCLKCFNYRGHKSSVQIRNSVTSYVGISGLDCRFLTMQEVFVGFPPLDSFNVETFELLTETSGIPLGLCVFKFNENQESAEFYKFLQESCMNPIYVDIVARAGLGVNYKLGHHLKSMSCLGSVPSKIKESAVIHDTRSRILDGSNEVVDTSCLKFENPPQTDPSNNPLMWWQFVAGYVPEEGGGIMKYLFEQHPLVRITFESSPPVILIGPLPMPLVCNLMEFRNLLSLFLQRTGVHPSAAEKIAICKDHHFGAPYNYSLLRFNNKPLSKEWLEKHKGKLVLSLKDGSSWPLFIHYSKPNWLCESCHKFNFPVRIQCFFCYKSRMSDHTPVTFRNNPTNCIGITGYQNWCATEELLFNKLPFLREIKNLTINYLKEPTGVPLGLCVLKSGTLGASEILFKKLQDALANEIARTNNQQPNRPLLVYIV